MRKNFHRVPNPRLAVEQFLKSESEKGNKVYWDRSHIPDGAAESHNNPGVGMYCVSAKARGDDDAVFAYESRRYFPLKSEADIEDMFTYYENDE